jgi:mono/diheme cytochrome c family protein
MKSFIKITTVLALILVLASCTNKRNRQVQYMGDTDMYVPVPYEAYSADSIFKNGMSAQLPVKGTIPRGKIPYDYPDSEVGYQSAKDSLKSPIKVIAPLDSIMKVSEVDVVQGKYLYGIYCATCHGLKGDGQGDLVKNEKFLGVPNYKDREITEGSIYHVLMYGRNLMGSHSSQLNDKERWQVVAYVEQLRSDLIK